MKASTRWAYEVFLGLPVALLVNRNIRAELPSKPLPATRCMLAEQDTLLAQSEARLQSIEAKATGVATVLAIAATAITIAIQAEWDHSGSWLRVLMVVSVVYAVAGLTAPLLLLGPIRRSAIDYTTLIAAAETTRPEQELAAEKSAAAAENSAQARRYSNLLGASRDSLFVALTALVV